MMNCLDLLNRTLNTNKSLTYLILLLGLLEMSCSVYRKNADSAVSNSNFNLQDVVKEEKNQNVPKVDEIKIDWKEDNLKYRDYEISKISKPYKGYLINLGVLIKRRERKILHYSYETKSRLAEYRFAALNLIKNTSENQLILESTLPKDWNYQIFNLYPNFTKIFDSGKYNLGREISVLDINGNGNYEISMGLMTFDYFGVNYRKGWVITPIIFEFDPKQGKYLYANQKFENYLLTDIKQKIDNIRKVKNNKTSAENYESKIYDAVMDVFLTYMYLGKEKEAWKIFEEYDFSDKKEVKAEIKKYLNRDELYREIYSYNKH